MGERREALFDDAFRAEFARHYDRYSRTYLPVALRSLSVALERIVAGSFDTVHASYVHVQPGRIKTAARLYAKAQRPSYASRIDTPEDIFRVVADVVGSRVVCSTLGELYWLADRIESAAGGGDASVVPVPGKASRDYVSRPRYSGYRAYHLNVAVPVLGENGVLDLPCEIQLRTALQEAWAKFTREDTHPHDVVLVGESARLARHVGEGLAAIDIVARDLADRLEGPAS